MEMALGIYNLTKVYSHGKTHKTAVDGISIEVPEGSLFGFLGANGAGKTTTIKTILDFIRPTSGSIRVFEANHNTASARSFIGYLPEQPYFHKFFKPIEVVSMHACLAGMPTSESKELARTALQRVGLGEYVNTPISKLSKGLTQRVGIAQAIVGKPKLLILDEPTSGLDPIGRRHIRDLLLTLKAEGTTIFLSSHLLGEVENICDYVAILNRGKLVTCGAPDSVRSPESKTQIKVVALSQEALNKLRFCEAEVTDQTDGLQICADSSESIYSIMRILEDHKAVILNITTQRETLEDAFLRLAA